MKKLITILIISFLSFPLFSQKFEFEPPLLYEYYYSQYDSGTGLFQFVYRINYDKLSFLKDGEEYSTKIRMTVELQDSVTNNISRASEDKTVSVAGFDETIDKRKSVQGLLNVTLEKKKYFLRITLADLQTNKDFAIPQLSIDLSTLQQKSFIVYTEENGKYYLANKKRTIPFSPKAYSFIYESDSSKTDSLCLKFQSQTDSLSFCSNTKMNYAFLLEEDSLGIYLAPQQKSPVKSYIFNDISLFLPEGKFLIKEGVPSKLMLEVKWWDKPFSLLNYEVALKTLSIIESKDVIDSLKSGSSRFENSNLFKFWKKYDPTPNSTYNELMSEFYSRADYAQKTFSNFTTPDGISTDRGKIYIQFGPPTNIERVSALNGRSLEVWFYKERDKKYYFRDNSGNGNYELVKE